MTDRARKAIEWVDAHVDERHQQTARADPWLWQPDEPEPIQLSLFSHDREGETLSEAYRRGAA